MQYYEFKDRGQQKYLLKIRNPHAKDNYTGSYSDRAYWSPIASQAVKRKDGYRQEGDDGVFYMEGNDLYKTFNTISVSDINFDYKVRFVEETWSGNQYRNYEIDNPTTQEVLIVIHISPQRRNPCSNRQTQARLDINHHGAKYNGDMLLHGGINYYKARLNRGRSTIKLRIGGGTHVNDHAFTIKTMAAQHVKIKRQGSRSDYQCYTFEDGIGNFDIKVNGVSNNCSKRTPPNWWHSSNHQPGQSYNSGSRGTPSSDSCVENALKNP